MREKSKNGKLVCTLVLFLLLCAALLIQPHRKSGEREQSLPIPTSVPTPELPLVLTNIWLMDASEQSVRVLYNGEEKQFRLAAPLQKELKDCIASIPRHSKEKLAAFSALLPVLADSIEVNDLLSEDNVTIGQLTKRYIKSHLSQKISLADIAGNLHCSIVTVTENFRTEFGITVMEYVMQKRLQKAERLLENRELSVRNVSEACGFSSVECFSRNFKNKYGMSPRDWKNANA